MKKAKLLLALLLLFIFPLSAVAGSNYVKVIFKGPKEVTAGQTYTYNISADFNCFYGRVHSISAAGAFELLPSTTNNIDIVYQEGVFINSVSEKTVEVRVKEDALPKDTGTISVQYDYTPTVADFPTSNQKASFSAAVSFEAPAVTSPPETESTSTASKKSTKPKKGTAIADEQLPLAGDTTSLASQIGAMSAGSVLRISGAECPLISRDALDALKENQIILTVDFDYCTCTIDGAHLGELAAGIDTIDLSVSLVKNAALSNIAGGMDAYQLHFAHNGSLPGRFLYTFLAAAHSPGDRLTLYCEDSGVISAKAQAVVDEKGTVTFGTDQCSSFFVADIESAAGLSVPLHNDGFSADEIDQAVQAAMQRAGVMGQQSVSVPMLIAAVLIASSAGALIAMAFGRKKDNKA